MLVNLAMETQADRTLVALLTETILELLSQVATLSAKLATAQSKNARLEKSSHCSAPAEHGHQASRNTTPSYQKLTQDRNIYSKSGQKLDPNRYLSSHWYKLEESHTSATCSFPKKRPEQIRNAAGHEGRVDMEQGVDQRRSYRVRRGGIR